MKLGQISGNYKKVPVVTNSEHAYNINTFAEFLTGKGLTYREFAEACGVTEKHVSNILAGRTRTARSKVRMKIEKGFTKLGADESTVQSAFSLSGQ